MSAVKQTFNPDYVVHPGAILEETLEARGLTKKDTASRCGIRPALAPAGCPKALLP